MLLRLSPKPGWARLCEICIMIISSAWLHTAVSECNRHLATLPLYSIERMFRIDNEQSE